MFRYGPSTRKALTAATLTATALTFALPASGQAISKRELKAGYNTATTAPPGASQRDLDACIKGKGGADATIVNCTRVIRGRSYSVHNRAVAYFMRGIIYLQDKKDPNRAFADCDQALKINRNFSGALYCRGTANYFRGNKARGIADIKNAAALGNPSAKQALRAIGKAQ